MFLFLQFFVIPLSLDFKVWSETRFLSLLFKTLSFRNEMKYFQSEVYVNYSGAICK